MNLRNPLLSLPLLLLSVASAREVMNVDDFRSEPISAKMEVKGPSTATGVSPGMSGKVREVYSVTKQYEVLETAFFQETDRLSKSFQDLGFEPPNPPSVFRYQKTKSRFSATLLENVGKCPAGSKWISVVSKRGGSLVFKRSVENPKCMDLTPDFREKALQF
ncbi:MAG TPA: hypothetical protein PKO15_09175 [Fibrobacteria bacterium]|nr:hypothetical protein [Fibrobacteria bacterium]HOX50043.1 hypothetical protein [Fibrobacteria bacterium]